MPGVRASLFGAFSVLQKGYLAKKEGAYVLVATPRKKNSVYFSSCQALYFCSGVVSSFRFLSLALKKGGSSNPWYKNMLIELRAIPTIKFTDTCVPNHAALMTAVRNKDAEVAWIFVIESACLSSQAIIKPLHARWRIRIQVRGV